MCIHGDELVNVNASSVETDECRLGNSHSADPSCQLSGLLCAFSLFFIYFLFFDDLMKKKRDNKLSWLAVDLYAHC